MDRCDFTTTMDVCNIGGVCVADGAVHAIYPCLVCDPSMDTTDWSARAAGAECRPASCAGGRLIPASTCDASGTCIAATSVACPTGACADATACEMACDATSCAAGTFCDTTPGRCGPVRALGERCGEPAECESGACADGRCCDGACDGPCLACDIVGSLGTCAPHRAGTDPDMECGAGGCDGAGACRGVDGGMPDAGADDGGRDDDAGPARDGGATDASLVPDAGSRGRPRDSGCGCASTPESPLSAAPLALVLAAILDRRRRRPTATK
jgi:uncharacterized protein (TIGR03382 family)